ncbi:Ion transport 2 domain-containing protein [Neobacillus bataviensis LMG 21833]|uniref:Ion transport 2 domain-containing protein n=1 Tax=Neobacillus bataviensis LMG 21833 TaxID=1117379 RepID=K6E803_9BACI|nr:potassium channel family protein [Neobacillus bataviensis]EKN69446.1 Ion transport 2 domain-containing protein [Neobacillus bataviensis LMG 21833]
MPNRVYISFLRLPLLIRILLIALLVFLSFGISIHFLEPETFPTMFDGIWWAIITASTVGYGDYVPHSFLGRLTALILILLGVGIVSSYFGTLAAAAVTKQDAFFEGRIPFKGNGQIIIIGWNERSKELIHKLTNVKYPQMIVLIDETLEANPLKSKFVHFIQGKGHVDETIIKSDIEKAEKVLITADRGNDELQADMNSILTLLTIKGLCAQVKCIVEILTAEQVVNAMRAGADEVIQSNKLTSVFMINSLHSNGDGLLSKVVHQLQESRLSASAVNPNDVGKTFNEVCQKLLSDGFLLIGIKRGEETILNPAHKFEIEESDELLTFK